MIAHELLLLGLLRESPKHGYEIKREIKNIVTLFAGVELKSIYYPLRVLEKNGLVTTHADKAGKRPQRIVYALTPKGEARFTHLLSDSFLNFKRPEFTLDLSLYFLNRIKPELARRRLRARTMLLKKLVSDLRQMIAIQEKKGKLSFTRILEHNLQMVESELHFLTQLIKTV